MRESLLLGLLTCILSMLSFDVGAKALNFRCCHHMYWHILGQPFLVVRYHTGFMLSIVDWDQNNKTYAQENTWYLRTKLLLCLLFRYWVSITAHRKEDMQLKWSICLYGMCYVCLGFSKLSESELFMMNIISPLALMQIQWKVKPRDDLH